MGAIVVTLPAGRAHSLFLPRALPFSPTLSARPKPLASPREDPKEDPDQARQIEADLRLVDRARAGRAGARNQLAHRLGCVTRILSILNARTGGHLKAEDIADLAQETLLVILRKLETYEGRSPLEGWAYRICYYEFMNLQRRRQRHAARTQSEETVPEPAQATEQEVPPAWERLERALEIIPVAEARVLRWKHLDGLTFDEIVRSSGNPKSTVKARYYRGLERVRELLSEDGEAGEK